MEPSPQTTPEVNSSDVPQESFYFYTFSNGLYTYVIPVVFVLGIFGNVMTLVIMRRMTSQGSTVNLYFISIAICDTVVLFTAAFPEWLKFGLGFVLIDKHSIVCKLFIFLMTVSPTVSGWLLVALTLQRALSVAWPHKVNLLCTRKRVLVVILGIIGFFALLYSHYLYGFDLVYSVNSTSAECKMTSSNYIQFTTGVFSYIELLVYCCLPFLLLVGGNAILVRKLSQSVKARQNLNASSARQKSANSVTLTVTVVSLTYVVLTLPLSVHFILFYSAINVTKLTGIDYGRVYFFTIISTILADVNHAINFYLYCLTGRRFREEFLRAMGCRAEARQAAATQL